MKLNPLIMSLIIVTITGCINSKVGIGNSNKSSIKNPSPTSPGQYKFVCESDIDPPTTVAFTPDGQNRPFIEWKSDYFEGYPPERRCREVTSRMNEYIRLGSPRYVTTGKINKWPVICVAEKKGSDCTALVYTLKGEDKDDPYGQRQDPQERLQKFLALNRVNFKGDPLVESPSCRSYIEIKAMMKWIVKGNETQDENLDKPEIFCTEQK